MDQVSEPLRDQIGRALYEEPGRSLNWYELSEERREPWRQDADRVLLVIAKADLCALKSIQQEE